MMSEDDIANAGDELRTKADTDAETRAALSLREYVDKNIAASPNEAAIVRRVWAALRNAEEPIVAVWDGEERTPAKTRDEVMQLVFNLDAATLITQHGKEVFLVLGNGNDGLDLISDYSMSLDAIMDGIFEWIEKRQNKEN